MKIVTILKTGCRWACVFLLAACGPSIELPITGEVRLVFVRKAAPGTHFMLKNQSSRAIALRGTYIESARVSPWNAWMKCARINSDIWIEGPYALVDGSEASVEIGSGKEVEVLIPSSFQAEFVDQYKEGLCKLNIELKGGAVVESNEFRP